MPRPGRKSFWQATRRRLNAGLTLLAYLLTAFGVPMPAGAASPCGGAACGCASAEVCRSGSCCCSTPVEAPCTGTSDCPLPCCQHGKPRHDCPSQAPTAPDGTDDAGGVRWALGISAMKCRGHSTLWVTSGVVLPVPPAMPWQPPLDRAGWLAPAADHALGTPAIPPDPPPRSVAV